MNNKVGN